MNRTLILGILVFDRIKEASRTQKVLSRFSTIIKTRLGFHELSQAVCSRMGTIILVVEGSEAEIDNLLLELQGIGGIEVQKMEFEKLK